jgi:hypothetical protein
MVIAGINGELIEKKIISSVDIPILYVTTGDMNNFTILILEHLMRKYIF